jgi:hypothetical protein
MGPAKHLGPDRDDPVNRQVVSDMMDGIGATIMGRNMFGPIQGAWVSFPSNRGGFLYVAGWPGVILA